MCRSTDEIRRFLRQTDYLDAEQPDNEGGIFAMISDNQNSNVRCDYLGLVPDGFDETIEIELFSYYIFEQDEENDKASDTESTFSSMQSLNSRHQVRKHL